MALRTEKADVAILVASAMHVHDSMGFEPFSEHRRTSEDVTFGKVPI